MQTITLPGWGHHKLTLADASEGGASSGYIEILKRGTWHRLRKDGEGCVMLCQSGKATLRVEVARLIMVHFKKQLPTRGQQVKHIDGDMYNCALDNMKWVSHERNH